MARCSWEDDDDAEVNSPLVEQQKGVHESIGGPRKAAHERCTFHSSEWADWFLNHYREPFDSRKQFWYRQEDKLKEDDAPWLTDLYALPNWALCLNYVNVGIATSFTLTPAYYYLAVDLEASAAIVNTYTALLFLPWCLKVFYGALTDLQPFLGIHRRSYYVIGWLVFILANAHLAFLGQPSQQALLFLSFVAVMGFMLSDVVADAQILECSSYESPLDKGRMRTHAYYVRQVGSVVGSLAGSVLYNGRSEGGTWSWGLNISQIFGLQALVAVSALIFVPFMYELPTAKRSLHQLLTATLNFVANDGVWVPLLYLYFFNFCYIANPAWTNFLFLSLNFTSLQYGLVATVGLVFSVLGLWAYEKFFFLKAWRTLYLYTVILLAFFSALQIALITGNTLGVSKFLFVAGDGSLQQFFSLLVFIPMCTMFFAMIPEGAEGTIYAFLSTWQNVASEASYQLGSRLTCYVDVTDEALERKKYRGILKLTVIVSVIQLLPVFGVYMKTPGGIRLLPNTIAETRAQCFPIRPNKPAAYFIFALFVGSIVFSFGQSILLALNPDSLCFNK